MSRKEEQHPLLGEIYKKTHDNTTFKRSPSRLEWAEQSWIRFFHVFSSSWIHSTLFLSSKKTLNDADLEELPDKDRCSPLLEQIKQNDWRSVSIWKVLIQLLGKESIIIGFWLIPRTGLRIGKILATRKIILLIGNPCHSSVGALWKTDNIYIYIIILLIIMLPEVCIDHWCVFQLERLALRIRNLLTLVVYKQLLSISSAASNRLTTAKVINLIANDVSTFQSMHVDFHYLWQAPFEILVVFIFLCWIIGLVPTFMGYMVLMFLLLIQTLALRKFHQFSAQSILFTDERIHRFYELITGCQIIKMFNWEKSFEERVLESRKKEFQNIQRTSHLRAFNLSLFFISTPIISMAVFLTIWILGQSLKPVDFFTVFAFFNQIRRPFLFHFPSALEKLSETWISWKRIQEFMQYPVRQDQQTNHFYQNSEPKGSVFMENASFSWNVDDTCLSSLTITIRPTSFVGIIGPVGSGKSSLLAAILGEMNLVDGYMHTVQNAFSYAPQSPWILSDTIRANIILDDSFDQERYSTVLHACCLDIDINTFEETGDLTMVGEKGANLSGGQKARLGLARALYAQADIYLLDDPLSAVDRRVAEQIYQRCFGPQGMLKDKTRILVTHLTQFLYQADQIIYLTDGHMQKLPMQLEKLKSADEKHHANETMANERLKTGSSTFNTRSIIIDETSPNRIYYHQLCCTLFTSSSFGCFGLVLLILFLVMGQVFCDATNYWIRLWSRQTPLKQQAHHDDIYIYLSLTLLTMIFALIRAHYCFHLVLEGSNRLHHTMLHKLLQTSLRFFERNPSGCILNRASRDQKVLDEILPATLFDGIQSFLMVLGSIVIFGLTSPWVLLSLVVLSPLCIIVGYFYACFSRQLVNIENNSRSILLTSITTSLTGLTTIRALRKIPTFEKIFIDHLDKHCRAYMMMIASKNWLGFWLDLLSGCFGLVIVVIAALSSTYIDQSAAALSMIYSINILTRIQSTIRQFTDCEIFFGSVERIDDYGRLPPEEDRNDEKSLVEPTSDWPKHGTIQFRHYSLRYRSTLDLALKDINFDVTSTEKLGIIGRTGRISVIERENVTRDNLLNSLSGAGKTSIFQSLFRFVDRSLTKGIILIDDIDISQIRLSCLRSHLSIIPQQPTLFTGTLRYNLDPLQQYTDEQCWTVLEAVQLKQMALNHSSGLYFPIAELGSNLSFGQRQLICVARAMLRQSKILLIDEATSNIDQETDRLIQEIIRDKYHDRTVLAIAHRLHTVSNYDRLIVLDHGKIINSGKPDDIIKHF